MYSRFCEYTEEELQQELINIALSEDTAAYEAGDWPTEQEHHRRAELLQEAADRIEYLKQGWSDSLVTENSDG